MRTLILLIAAAFSCSGATIVQKVSGSTNCGSGTGTNCNSNTLSATGAGNLLIFIAFANGAGITWSSVAGGCSTAWVQPAAGKSNAHGSTFLAYCLSSSAGATSITSTVSSSGTGRTATVYEISPTASDVGFALEGVNNANNASGSTPSGIGFTLNGRNDVMIQNITASNTISSINGSYNADFIAGSRGTASLINSIAGSAPTWTLGGSTTSDLTGIAFAETNVVRRVR